MRGKVATYAGYGCDLWGVKLRLMQGSVQRAFSPAFSPLYCRALILCVCPAASPRLVLILSAAAVTFAIKENTQDVISILWDFATFS